MDRSQDLLNELKIDRNSPPPDRRGLWIGLAIATVLLLLIAAAAWWFTRAKPLAVQTTVAVAIGGSGGSTSVLDATGYVVARRQATVSSKVTGRLKDVRIEEGQHVDEGQIMATLDPVDADAQQRLANAQVQAVRSQVASVQAQLTQAEADARRTSELASRKLVSRSQLDAAVAQRDSLRAQLDTSRHNVQVAQDQASIAANGVDNTIVRAPFAGVIIAKSAQPGEIVSPLSAGGGFTRTGIGTIVDMDSLEIEVDVNESYIGRVQPKMPVEAVLNAYPDWKIPAEVIAIIPTADRGKATVKVRIALKVKDGRIVPDMGVKVSFLEAAPTGAPKDEGVHVPDAAIAQRDGKSVVFVVDDKNIAEQRVVGLGREMADDRQVLKGLSAGESVVVNPPSALANGAKVTIAAAATDAN